MNCNDSGNTNDGPVPPEGQPQNHNEASSSPPPSGDPPPVILRGLHRTPLVLGEEVERLNRAGYDVIKVLDEAGVDGLNKDELDEKSGHSEARKILARLRKRNEKWAAVIQMARKGGGGYRIVNPNDKAT